MSHRSWHPRWRRRVVALLAVVAAAWVAAATALERRAIAAQAPRAAAVAASPPRIDTAALMATVRTLAAPSMAGRRTGTPGGRAARRFVHDAFAAIGLEPVVPGYEQPFRFTHISVSGFVLPNRNARTEYDDAANVLGRVAGSQGGARTIVVSAHYDHLGVRDGTIYPGADDDASGVAVLIECARYFHAHPPRHPMLFAAFDAEELGLEGAKAFMRMPPLPVAAIALDVSLDMLSRNDRNEIYAAGTYHYPWLKPLLQDVQQRAAVKILFGHDRPIRLAGTVDDWTLESDHGVFFKAGIPFVYFGVEDHPDYHQPTDTADRIDPVFFGHVAEMTLDALLTFDRQLP